MAIGSQNFIFLAVLFGLIGLAYTVVSMARLSGQRLLPSILYEPLSRLHVFIVVPVSILVLEDRIVRRELIATLLALCSILMITFSRKRKGEAYRKRIAEGLGLVVIAGIIAAGLQLISKVLVSPDFIGQQVPVLTFVLGSNLSTLIISSIRHLTEPQRGRIDQTSIALGFAAGTANAIALCSLLTFLIDGKPSRIYSVGAASMLIPILISFFRPNEPNPRPVEVLAMILALTALVLQSLPEFL